MSASHTCAYCKRPIKGAPATITEPGKATLYYHPEHVQYRDRNDEPAETEADAGVTLDAFVQAFEEEDREQAEAFAAWYRAEGISNRLTASQWVRLFSAFVGRDRPKAAKPEPFREVSVDSMRASLAAPTHAPPKPASTPKSAPTPKPKPPPPKASDAELVTKIQGALTDELRQKKYRGNPSAVAGHCYVASEALWHLKGGPKSGLHPMNVKHEGTQHWFLKSDAGEIIDPTSAQFKTPVPYAEARGRGFLTTKPSKRAAEVIRRVKAGIGMTATPAPVASASKPSKPGKVSKKELDLAAALLRERGFAYLDKDGTSRDGSRLVTDLGPAIVHLAKNGLAFAIDQGGGWTRYALV